MQRFTCDCGNRLFFDNTDCLACARKVSWCPVCATLTALDFNDKTMRCARCHTALWQCANRLEYNVCNRSVMAPDIGTSDAPVICDCCRYNDTIPDLSVDGNLERWRSLEQAKRRLINGLDNLGLPHGSRADGFDPGLSFDFKGDSIGQGLWRNVGAGEKVYTGHDGGKITINICEADAVEREKLRVDFAEGHRTLIGHFRHEIGHYYWDLLVAGNADHEPAFRALFGDHDNPDYGTALEQYYANGPRADWQGRYVSAYATMHPWEDWAETFAFYLDIVDVMETAAGSGLINVIEHQDIVAMIEDYVRFGILMNELNRNMGLIDFMPEVVAPDVTAKLQFVDTVITGASAHAFQQTGSG
jgi:hypothetical protein